MAFGLIQWLISLTIFVIVLLIITWSAIHLSMKNQNKTDINVRFLDINDISMEWQNKSISSTIMHNSTLQAIENTSSAALFANDQNSEIPNSVQFYNILRNFYSTEDEIVKSTNHETITATFAPTIETDFTWNTMAITLYNASDKNFVLNDYGNVTILSNISQKEYLTLTRNMKTFNGNELWKSNGNHSIKIKLLKYPWKEKYESSNKVLVTHPLFNAKQSNTTEE